MIFVTVGLHNQPFDRLIRAMDGIAARTDEKVVMQIGHTTYVPQHAQYFHFTTGDEMSQWYRKARVVVAHGGSSAAEILYLGKPLVVVPRLAKHGEHIDDHQLDFVRAMEHRGLIEAVCDIERLEETLAGIDPRCAPLDDTRKRMLIEALQGYLRSIDELSR